ncbi:RNA polymerase-associated protein [Rhodotorula paludigena]|uniref:RNA polymerase-associated protein n=1 Tax=Rhodotorula paludigena TaxID=86838 RepID=UPI00317DC54C
MDFDEELLGLAGAGGSKRKSKTSSKSNKRKRAEESDDGSASDMDMSSDSDAEPAQSRARRSGPKSSAKVDSDGEDDDNPYPVEGIYTDAAERARVQDLPELEREEFIANRQEQINERETRKQVAKLAARSGGAAAGGDSDVDDDDEEYEATRGTRSRKATGSSKTKAEGYEKLRKSRAEKGKKKEKKADDSDDEYEDEPRKSRRRKQSSDAESGSDMDESDEEDASRTRKAKSKKAGPEPASLAEMSHIIVTRAKLAQMCAAPWFKDWVVGAFVRVVVGMNPEGRQYRLAEVTDITPAREPYRFENATSDIRLVLTIGKEVRVFTMDQVSNAPCSDREYDRYIRTCRVADVDVPTSKRAGKIKNALAERTEYRLTEEDLAKKLAAKGPNFSGPGAKAKLRVLLTDARASGDEAKAQEYAEQLAKLEGPAQEDDRAKRINERNRASNREEIKRAEAKSQELRRKQADALARGETDVKVDPSARVKTMPRLNYDSRPHTPTPGTPNNGAAASANGAAAAAAAATGTPRAKGSKIELASQVQLDVDLDF